MQADIQQMLQQIFTHQSVLLVTDFHTEQSELVNLLHQAELSRLPESLISLEFIAPEKSALGIEIVRNIQEQLRYAATAQRPRWIALLRADTLTIAAQNALLKILEEPPPHTVLLLVTSHPHRLLPTITSRLIQVSQTEITEGLNSPVPKKNSESDIVPDYEKLCANSVAQACERAEEFSDKESAMVFTHLLLQQIYTQLQENIASTKPYQQHLEAMKFCIQSQQYLEANCNVKLVMGELFLGLCLAEKKSPSTRN